MKIFGTKFFSSKKTARGFSFGEVIISAFVISVGLTAIVALFASNYRESAFDRDRIVAAELAQEGVEIVRNIRDNNLASGTIAFNNFLAANKDNCNLDYLDTAFDTTGGAGRNCFGAAKNNELRKFSLDLVNGYYKFDYSPSRSVQTHFGRDIYLERDDKGTPLDESDDAFRVVSIVWWGGSGVFPGAPGSYSGNDPNIAQIASWCTAGNKCVYSRAVLESWR